MKSELEAFLRKRHCRVPRPSRMRSTHSGESCASEIDASAARVRLQGGSHFAGHRRGGHSAEITFTHLEDLLADGIQPPLMNDAFNSEYPSIEHLREKARKRMPGFAFDYLESGCNSDINLARNTADIRKVQLRPYYIGDYRGIEPSDRALRGDLRCPLRHRSDRFAGADVAKGLRDPRQGRPRTQYPIRPEHGGHRQHRDGRRAHGRTRVVPALPSRRGRAARQASSTRRRGPKCRFSSSSPTPLPSPIARGRSETGSPSRPR